MGKLIQFHLRCLFFDTATSDWPITVFMFLCLWNYLILWLWKSFNFSNVWFCFLGKKNLDLWSSMVCFTIHCGDYVFTFSLMFKLEISSGGRQWYQGDGRRDLEETFTLSVSGEIWTITSLGWMVAWFTVGLLGMNKMKIF